MSQRPTIDHQVIKMLSEKHDCKIWVCRDGSLVPVKLMADRHVAAAWRHQKTMLTEVNRAISENVGMALTALSYFNPDSMAAYYIESQWDDDFMGFNTGAPSDAEQKRYTLMQHLSTLKAEAERRGKPHLTPE